MRKIDSKFLGGIVCCALVLVTLTVSPFTTLDPISIPKLSLLSFFAIFALPLALLNFAKLRQLKSLALTLLLFCLQLIASLLGSDSNIESQFYGSFSRNTGTLAYFSLAILMLISAYVSETKFLDKFFIALVVTGLVLVCYGFIQFAGLDPFPFQNFNQNDVFGTFGNPDFMSAFLGILSIITLTLGTISKVKKSSRALYLILGFSALLLINLTHSIQGFYSFFVALVAVLILYFVVTKQLTLARIFMGIGLLCGTILVFGLVNLGPLANAIAKSSLTARQYYWRAAVRILVEKPVFGVGMDNYGDWARRFRSLEEATKNPGFLSDVSHNVPLDIAVGGGVPLLISYLFIALLTLRSIYRVTNSLHHFDTKYFAVVGGWVAYQAQSLISINQLGLAIWGWVLSGIILGYEINLRNKSDRIVHAGVSSIKQRSLVIKEVSYKIAFGLLLALVASVPQYISAAKFYHSLTTGNPTLIQSAAYLHPLEKMRFLYVARALNQNSFHSESIMVLRNGVRIYPDSFDLWQLWTTIPLATPLEIAQAKSEMKRLDPNNPNLR